MNYYFLSFHVNIAVSADKHTNYEKNMHKTATIKGNKATDIIEKYILNGYILSCITFHPHIHTDIWSEILTKLF